MRGCTLLTLLSLLVACAAACESRLPVSDPGAGSSSNPAPPSRPAPPAMSTPGSSSIPGAGALRVQPVAAGYGGVGPATPAPHPNLWVVVLLAAHSGARAIDVQVTELQLLDAGGAVVARGTSPWSVRRDTGSDAGAPRRDFGEAGTVPFDGVVEAAAPVLLRIHAPLDTRAEALPGKPVRFRATLRAVGGPPTAVEGPLEGPWPTG